MGLPIKFLISKGYFSLLHSYWYQLELGIINGSCVDFTLFQQDSFISCLFQFRGAVFFLIAVMGLLLFDHDDDTIAEYSIL